MTDHTVMLPPAWASHHLTRLTPFGDALNLLRNQNLCNEMRRQQQMMALYEQNISLVCATKPQYRARDDLKATLAGAAVGGFLGALFPDPTGIIPIAGTITGGLKGSADYNSRLRLEEHEILQSVAASTAQLDQTQAIIRRLTTAIAKQGRALPHNPTAFAAACSPAAPTTGVVHATSRPSDADARGKRRMETAASGSTGILHVPVAIEARLNSIEDTGGDAGLAPPDPTAPLESASEPDTVPSAGSDAGSALELDEDCFSNYSTESGELVTHADAGDDDDKHSESDFTLGEAPSRADSVDGAGSQSPELVKLGDGASAPGSPTAGTAAPDAGWDLPGYESSGDAGSEGESCSSADEFVVV